MTPLESATRGAATPASFARLASGGEWKLAPHLDLLNYYLLLVYMGAISRLMVWMPPRHGKSEFTSRYFPAWYIGRRPSHRVLLTSYEADFASQWGQQARDLLIEHGRDVFGVTVDSTVSARNRWKIAGQRGGMQTAGVGGPLTGKGGNINIIDDPVKNDEEANSPVMREKQWNWYRATFRTRLEPSAAIIVIQTRWHEDDLSGRILQHHQETRKDGEADWVVLNLPAVAEYDEAIGGRFFRQEGEALWPERYSVKALEAIQRDVGSYWFSALYQQRPQPAGGGMFKREFFRYHQPVGSEGHIVLLDDGRVMDTSKLRRFLTVDLAASTKTSADFTVVAAWAITPAREVILLDLVRKRLEGPDQPEMITSMADKHKVSQILVESTGYQLTMVQGLRRQGRPVRELKADKDKVSRALVAAARVEGGGVFFPRLAPWLDDFETELVLFPNAAHDDQVDPLAYACVEAQMGHGQQLFSF